MRRPFAYPASLLLLLALYFAGGKFGLSLAFVHANVSAIWPPTGLALAALLLWGYRLWPAIFVGAFFVNFTTAGSWATSLGIAAGNTLEALAGAWLVNRFANGASAFDHPQFVLRFSLAAILSTAVSATFGAVSLVWGGFAAADRFLPMWITWWLGDLVSALIVAPLILIWIKTPVPVLTKARAVEGLVLLLILGLISDFVFFEPQPLVIRYQLKFLALPLVIWAAFRFGLHGAISSSFIMSAAAVWRGLRSQESLEGFSPNEFVLLLQGFMATITLTSLAVASAIAERAQAENALRESEARKGAILGSALDCIITIDHQGKIIEVNGAVEPTFGYTHAEMLGKEMAELIIPERYRAAHYKGLAHYLATRAGPVLGRRIEMSAIRRDGTEFPVELGIVPIEREGKPLFTGTLRDITARKQAEQALHQARAELQQQNEKLEALVEQRTAKLRETIGELESYSYSISHDMRAPLRAMQAYSQVLLTDYNQRLDSTGKRYLDRIMASANRLDKLIQDVLTYSRIARADVTLESVNLDRLVDDIINEYPAVHAAEVEICNPLGSVVAAEALLMQCLANLLTNAAKFVKPREPARIKIWSEELQAANRPALRLFIQDQGIGIAPKDQERIFGIFARVYSESEYEGTGIGLSIVKKAVERMGGQVGLQSQFEHGATFWIQLPRA